MTKKKLTDKQELLRAALMDPAFQGNPRKAMDAVGYSKQTKLTEIFQGQFAEVIAEDARQYLSIHSHKAVQGTIGVLDDPTAPGNREKLAAANSIMDRVGLSKREQVIVTVDAELPLFHFPVKAKPPTEED